MWGSSSAGPAPLGPGAPDDVVERAGQEPARKVQLAVRAEDRAVTKAVLRAGGWREEGRRGPGMASRDHGDGGPAPAQGHVATASR